MASGVDRVQLRAVTRRELTVWQMAEETICPWSLVWVGCRVPELVAEQHEDGLTVPGTLCCQ